MDVTAASRGWPTEDGQLTPETIVSARKRLGLEAKSVRRDIKDFHLATLPVVLFLKDGSAAVLTEWIDRKTVKVVAFAEQENIETEVSVRDLKEQHTGYAVMTHSAPHLPAHRSVARPSGQPR